jgi:hypothetical protein
MARTTGDLKSNGKQEEMKTRTNKIAERAKKSGPLERNVYPKGVHLVVWANFIPLRVSVAHVFP